MSDKSGFVRIDTLSRRDALRRIALALTAGGIAGTMRRADGAEVHEQVEQERTLQGEYKVKYFNEHEFKTLERLSELIVPEDEGGPSAREGGAPEFIDLLASENAELAAIFTGGILWLDHRANQSHGHAFAECTAEQQDEMLVSLVEAERTETGPDTEWQTEEHARFSVFGVRKPSDLRRGLVFFDWARRLVVDAYYTSPAGIKDLGFLGNASHSEYRVPGQAIAHVVERGPFRDI